MRILEYQEACAEPYSTARLTAGAPFSRAFPFFLWQIASPIPKRPRDSGPQVAVRPRASRTVGA
jgi:hypothetical protein